LTAFGVGLASRAVAGDSWYWRFTVTGIVTDPSRLSVGLPEWLRTFMDAAPGALAITSCPGRSQ
jgi:hypothetical protein